MNRARQRRRVVVTGATGFVGREVLRQLLSGGHEVVAIVRSVREELGAARVAVVPNLRDEAALRTVMAGADSVIHLAARVHVMRERTADPLAEFRAVNVDGTRALRDAAIAAGLRRFTYISSIKVHGEMSQGRLHAEAAIAPMDPYGRSKAEAEALLADAAMAGLEWSVVRPPLVYGPGVGGNFRRLLRIAALTKWCPLPLGGIENRRSLVARVNLASAILAVTFASRASGRAYLVSDGEDLSTSELLRRLANALGHEARLMTAPVTLLAGAASALGLGAEAQRIFSSFQVDASPLREDLGWQPPVTIEAALRDTAAWWTERNR
jgi:nucleoside-diphosphate-sugar epimerase